MIGEECGLNSKHGAPVFGKSWQGNTTFSSDVLLPRYELLTEHEIGWISQYGKCSLKHVWLDLCCDKQEAKGKTGAKISPGLFHRLEKRRVNRSRIDAVFRPVTLFELCSTVGAEEVGRIDAMVLPEKKAFELEKHQC